MRRLLVVAGVLVMLYAVVGAVGDLGGKVGGVLIFLAAVLVLHDGVWMPLVLLAGRFLTRPAARVTAIVATGLTMAALPLALGFGRSADNPSALPLHYARNLAVLLAGVLVVGVVTALAGRKTSTTGRRPADR